MGLKWRAESAPVQTAVQAPHVLASLHRTTDCQRALELLAIYSGDMCSDRVLIVRLQGVALTEDRSLLVRVDMATAVAGNTSPPDKVAMMSLHTTLTIGAGWNRPCRRSGAAVISSRFLVANLSAKAPVLHRHTCDELVTQLPPGVFHVPLSSLLLTA